MTETDREELSRMRPRSSVLSGSGLGVQSRIFKSRLSNIKALIVLTVRVSPIVT